MMFREQIKWLFFPGLNLNARLRFRVLPKFFGRPKPGEQRLVLDAGCGNGYYLSRLQPYFPEKTYTGIDISPEMVDQLRAKPGGADIKVTMGSFADVSVVGRFDLVYVVFNTFYMLRTREEQMRCVQRVAEHLSPGGSFVLEGFLLNQHEYPTTRRGVKTRAHSDATRSEATQRPHETQNITLDYAGVGIGGVRRFPLDLRVPSPSELDLMARSAGLRLSTRWSDWDAEPFTEQATKHVSIYTAARPPPGSSARR